MSSNYSVNGFLSDFSDTVGALTGRKKMFENAPDTPIPSSYAVNRTAAALHPDKQNLVVRNIESFGDDVKCYTLGKNPLSPLAYFRAGQYICVTLEINGAKVTRPYSIASSPALALNGEYKICVKRVPNGFVSGWILDNWQVGTPVTVGAPEGTFYYEGLRDAKTVIGCAGGSGITPFLSLAHSIAEGKEDAELILLYGCRNLNEILFKDELDRLASLSDRVKVVYVLSEQKKKGYENGFITAKLIRKYAPEGAYSVFACGPEAMYTFLEKELATLELRKKFIRFELFGETKNAAALPGYPEGNEDKVYRLTVVRNGKQTAVSARGNESLLVAMERAGLVTHSACRSGVCGVCRARLASGTVFIPEISEHRRTADILYGYVHPCCTYPTSDTVLYV